MGLFTYNEKYEYYEVEIDGIQVVTSELFPDCEKKGLELVDAYKKKLPDIVDFMMDEITDYYGKMTKDKLIKKLGKPQIDIDREMVLYLEHTLDQCHIIDFEFSGLMEKFYYLSIDG